MADPDKIAISIHALREEGDLRALFMTCSTANFYPRPPRGGRQLHDRQQERPNQHFYPRPPRGGRQLPEYKTPPLDSFLSTPSARRATSSRSSSYVPQSSFLSTPSARRATRFIGRIQMVVGFLSTPSARRATPVLPRACCLSRFLSTPSARRATEYYYSGREQKRQFLSTPSARRATKIGNVMQETTPFLSTPSARRATLAAVTGHSPLNISIHALREEGDGVHVWIMRAPFFISIHALREEGDTPGQSAVYVALISIHALREEGDRYDRAGLHRLRDFYPRPPRGGRRTALPPATSTKRFLSTPSARRATRHLCFWGRRGAISIHALREEGDWSPP